MDLPSPWLGLGRSRSTSGPAVGAWESDEEGEIASSDAGLGTVRAWAAAAATTASAPVKTAPTSWTVRILRNNCSASAGGRSRKAEKTISRISSRFRIAAWRDWPTSPSYTQGRFLTRHLPHLGRSPLHWMGGRISQPHHDLRRRTSQPCLQDRTVDSRLNPRARHCQTRCGLVVGRDIRRGGGGGGGPLGEGRTLAFVSRQGPQAC